MWFFNQHSGVTRPAQGLQLTESLFGHQNVSSPDAGIKPNNLAAEASMCANH